MVCVPVCDNPGIVPPWLRPVDPVVSPCVPPLNPNVPRILCDHDWSSDPVDRGSCRDCFGVGVEEAGLVFFA